MLLKIITVIILIGSAVQIGLGYYDSSLQVQGATLISIIFIMIISAILFEYGDDLMERVKKLGPMEFFEKKINEIYFDERFSPDPIVGTSDPNKEISEEEFFKFQSSDLFIAFLEFSNTNPLKLKNKDKILDIYRSNGIIAFYKKDYFKAISRFEKLRSLNGDSYDRLYNIGLSYLKIAEKEKDKERRISYFQKSLENFNCAKLMNKDDFEVYYHIAWVLDELGIFGKAIDNNRKCYELNPKFYAAKYNIAVSLTKMDEYEKAFKELKEIPTIDDIWKIAEEDKELKKLRDHEEFGKKVEKLIKKRLKK